MNEDNANNPKTPSVPADNTSPPVPVVAPAPVIVSPTNVPAPAPAPAVAAPAAPIASVQPAATVATPVPAPVSSSPAVASSGPAKITSAGSAMKSKWLLPVVFVAVLVLGGSAAAYISVFKKSPGQIWSSGLASMSDGLDKLIELEGDSSNAVEFNAKLNVSKPVVVDGSFKGSASIDGSAIITADIGAAGYRAEAEIRSVPVEGSEFPDLYAKVDGLSSLSALAGGEIGSQLTQMDGQWYSVDHTLLAQIGETAGAQLDAEDYDEGAYREDVKKLSALLRDTLFSSSEGKAVFEVQENIGKEDFEGTDTYRFKAGVNKEGLKNFMAEFVETIEDTKISEFIIGRSGSGESISEMFELDEFNTEVDEADFSKATADVWIASHGKFVRNIRIYIDDEKTSYIDLALPYEGGDIIPLEMKLVTMDAREEGEMTVRYEINVKESSVKAVVSADIEAKSSGSVEFTAEFNAKGVEEAPQVTKPSGAKNIYELIGNVQEQLGGGYSPSYDYPSSSQTDLDALYDDWDL